MIQEVHDVTTSPFMNLQQVPNWSPEMNDQMDNVLVNQIQIRNKNQMIPTHNRVKSTVVVALAAVTKKLKAVTVQNSATKTSK